MTEQLILVLGNILPVVYLLLHKQQIMYFDHHCVWDFVGNVFWGILWYLWDIQYALGEVVLQSVVSLHSM